MKSTKTAFALCLLTAGAVQANEILIDKTTDGAGVTAQSRFADDDIDNGLWVQRTGASWSVSGGALVNAAALGTTVDDQGAHLLNTVSIENTNFTAVTVTFDYDVGEGSTLYFYTSLFTGTNAVSGNMARMTEIEGEWYANDFDVDFTSAANLKDGSDPVNTTGGALASFVGGTAGTFSQTYTISGFTGINSIADVSHILVAFTAATAAAGNGAISIDNLELRAINPGDTPRPAQPNFVIMLADDLGWQDLKVYDLLATDPFNGNPGGTNVFETPYLDDLAAEGIIFTQGYSSAPTCAPSRCGLMSGKYPARIQKTHVSGGVIPKPGNLNSDKLVEPYYSARLEVDEITIPEALKPYGYFSGHSGKWHMATGHNDFPQPLDQGFDWTRNSRGITSGMGGIGPNRVTGFATTDPADAFQLQDIDGNATTNGFAFDQTTQNAIDFIDLAVATNKPFFCYYATWLVHTPVQMRTERLLEKYATRMGMSYPLDGSAITNPGQNNPYYAAMVESLDFYVHRIIKHLKETDDPRWPGHKLIENTYIFFSSDNGAHEAAKGDVITDNYPLDQGKKHAEEGGTRVAFMVTGPDVPTNVVSDVMVNQLDWYPTILSLAGIDVPDRLDGKDLSTLILNDPQDAQLVTNAVGEVRDTMYWHYPHDQSWHSTIRRGDWKLFHNWNSVENAGVNPYRLYQLYTNGLPADIEEAIDLWDVETNLVAELSGELDAWFTEVDAYFPYYNPAYTGTLPGKDSVPVVGDTGHTNGTAWVTFTGTVASVELLYTLNGGDSAEEWFDMDAAFTNGAPTGYAEAVIPEGTTHYVFMLLDTNRFIVNSVDVGASGGGADSTKVPAYVPHVAPPSFPTLDAVLTHAGTIFPTGDVLIAQSSGSTAASVVDTNLTVASLAEGQTFTVTNLITLTKLTLATGHDKTFGSGTNKLALWIGEYDPANFTPSSEPADEKVYEWVDFADVSVTNDSFITIDFADAVLAPGTYAFQLAWPTNDADHQVIFNRGAGYDGGQRLAKNGTIGTSTFLPYSGEDGSDARDLVFALHGSVLAGYNLWAYQLGLTDNDPGANPDGDRLVNLMEYALGGNPDLGNDDGLLPTVGKSAGESFYGLEYIYRRRRDAAAHGLSYEVQATTNLVSTSWSTNGVTETGTADIDNDFESVTNRVLVGDVGFVTLQVEQAE